MGGIAVVEGLPELRAAFARVDSELELELREVSLAAAAAGVNEARSNHPYTDRTFHLSGEGDGGSEENSHADQTVEGEAEMIWPVEYASFVDRGTSRSRPYPFTPQAEAKAAEVLATTESRVDRILGGF